MLPLKPNSTIKTNIFGDIWTSQKTVGSSNTNSMKQTPRFHTPRFIQGLEANLDEHRKVTSMFQ